MKMVSDHEAIHEWFSLSYANYLVVPRSVLQSMPDEWQARFVECLEEMDKAFGHLDWPTYDVRALVRSPDVIEAMIECEDCAGKGHDAEGEDCPGCGAYGEVPTNEGDRYETAEEVGIRTDPIPHYERGRTRIEPR